MLELDMGAARLGLALCVAGALACGSTAPARAQAFVVIDADVPVLGQVEVEPKLSFVAAIDFVRVEPIDASGMVQGTAHDIVASDPLDWPISFGVVSGSSVAHFRVRAFRSALVSNPDDVTQAPAVIDRLVDVPVPTSGIGAVRVVLRGDCFGVKASLLDHTTCVDGAHLAGSPSDGLEALSDTTPSPTQVGTWAKAIEQLCRSQAPPGSVCIPGGVTFLGDLRLARSDNAETTLPAVPLRPVALRPFFLDVTEFTVGRFRSLASRIKGTMPSMPNPTGPLPTVFCTWLGPSDASNDALPLNCLPSATAAEACSLSGGRLPTESEWEHAARGRGQQRTYPWGDTSPSCCSTNISFPITGGAFGGATQTCPKRGIVAVGSFKSDPCGGVNDVSRDGLLDLAGNVSEWVQDQYAAYDDPCWGSGVPLDPICPLQPNMTSLARGSDFSADNYDPAAGMAAVRVQGITAQNIGFRCAYEDGAP